MTNARAGALAVALLTVLVGDGRGLVARADSSTHLSGVLLENRNTAVRPQDDFYTYVNGSWIGREEIPADKSSYGNFSRLSEEADEEVRKIIEAAASSPDSMIGQLYNSFMDEARVNDLGIAPLAPGLARIEAIDNQAKLLAYIGYAGIEGVKTPLDLGISEDFDNPTRYRIYVTQSGLGLPNSDYYNDESEHGQSIIAAYQEYMRAMYRKLGYDAKGAERAAAATWGLESRLASLHRPPVENREYTRWYNLYGKDHSPLPDGVDWDAYLGAFGLSSERVISIGQPEYVTGLAEVLAQTALPVWKDYLKLRLASSSAAYLSQDLQDLAFDFYSRTLSGVPEMRPRWKRGVGFVNGAAGDAVGKIYVEKHFPPAAKARMDELVNNLILAFRESIESLDWMGEKTRANAVAKLDKFTPNIGYPDKWKDYSSMKISEDLLANARSVSRWEMEQDLARLDGPVDKGEWFMNPQDVNAYYYSLQNSITFPAAILQPPFFDLAADDAINYGAIGAIIGHEIGHGFDDNGSQFDGDGRLHNWWTDADREAFVARTARLIEQYDAFEVLPGVAVNGSFTQGENIGDLAGVSIAYRAYLRSLGGKPAPQLDGYTGEQRFFIGFAQAFLSKTRDEQARQMVKTDTHSPERFRVNGSLSNVDGFYRAFSIKPGDALYLAPEKRVQIW
jgi:predicted metalloendopeptidase